MSCDDEMVHLLEFTIGLPIHQQQVLTVKDHQNKGQNLVVTLLSAGHCVGSVMFLIEGSGGKVLYTGDFRLGEKEISKIPTSFCNVKSVYVDTTFCCPLVPDFPTRVDTTEAIISIIKSNFTATDEKHQPIVQSAAHQTQKETFECVESKPNK
ncbi:protein artemis-like isoform X2 [Clytia hemisphaerica]|uniref:protein artemis-like isoform X2 n=1 Tax=Clytia hemisphaerica TaxID=252671 RepID=UPI0034D432BE